MTAQSTLVEIFSQERDTWQGITMRDYDVLYTLAKHGEPMRVTELQHGVLLSQPALSRLVDRLVARGLVSKCTDTTDGRAVRVSLTAAGAQKQRAVGVAHARSVTREVGGALGDDELRELERLCTRLTAAAVRPSEQRDRVTAVA